MNLERNELSKLYKSVKDMSEFELNHRFTEEKYNVLSKEDLSEILPLNKKGRNELDRIIDKLGFRKRDKLNGDCFDSIDELNMKTKSEIEIRNWLNKININSDEHIYVLWDSWGAAITKWKIFKKYYDDFFYPVSDDLIVVDKSLSWALYFFHEEIVFYGRRTSM